MFLGSRPLPKEGRSEIVSICLVSLVVPKEFTTAQLARAVAVLWWPDEGKGRPRDGAHNQAEGTTAIDRNSLTQSGRGIRRTPFRPYIDFEYTGILGAGGALCRRHTLSPPCIDQGALRA